MPKLSGKQWLFVLVVAGLAVKYKAKIVALPVIGPVLK